MIVHEMTRRLRDLDKEQEWLLVAAATNCFLSYMYQILIFFNLYLFKYMSDGVKLLAMQNVVCRLPSCPYSRSLFLD
jgi:hypothetical protein